MISEEGENMVKRKNNEIIISKKPTFLFTGIISMLGIIFLKDILQLFKFPKEIFDDRIPLRCFS